MNFQGPGKGGHYYSKPSQADLMQAGKRAVHKGECVNVVVAPDHTGELNYHNCNGSVNHATTPGEQHYCGCGYVWKETGEIVNRPEWGQA